jgi:hypothetical protein
VQAGLDDSRYNVLPLGECLGVGDALSCLAGSGTSPWALRKRHNQTRVSPMRTAGPGRSSFFWLLIVSFFSTAARWRRAMNSVGRRLLFLQWRDLQLVAHLRPRAVDRMGR